MWKNVQIDYAALSNIFVETAQRLLRRLLLILWWLLLIYL